MLPPIPPSWLPHVKEALQNPSFNRLRQFLDDERLKPGLEIYPPEQDTFQALELTPYENVKVLLLGQDPYFGPNQAHGLCFSVRPTVPVPPSLRNIYKELGTDMAGFQIPDHGYLGHWARQGILMLNAVLSVRAGKPNSHKDRGWEDFTDAIIGSVNAKQTRVVFVLWGGYAQKKAKLITGKQHAIVTAAHPSPLSAKGFFGKKSFSAINKALEEVGKPKIDWQIPPV